MSTIASSILLFMIRVPPWYLAPGGHGRGGANSRCRGFYEYLFIIYCLMTLDLSTRRGALTNLCSIDHAYVSLRSREFRYELDDAVLRKPMRTEKAAQTVFNSSTSVREKSRTR